MNISFIKKTNLSSLLVLFLTTLQISLASDLVKDETLTINDNNDYRFKVIDFGITSSTITSKLFNINNKFFNINNNFVFLQYGHNLFLKQILDGTLEKLNSIECTIPIGVFVDFVYRNLLFYKNFNFNIGVGYNKNIYAVSPKLVIDKFKADCKHEIVCDSGGYRLFGLLNHNDYIEVSLQGDFSINNSKVVKGYKIIIEHPNKGNNSIKWLGLKIEFGNGNYFNKSNYETLGSFVYITFSIKSILGYFFNLPSFIKTLIPDIIFEKIRNQNQDYQHINIGYSYFSKIPIL